MAASHLLGAHSVCGPSRTTDGTNDAALPRHRSETPHAVRSQPACAKKLPKAKSRFEPNARPRQKTTARISCPRNAQPTRVVDSNVVDTLARLQQLAATLGATDALDSLPQIVVLGSQSAGKSSTIESLVGLSFLPRGTGIVTRCPLLLHLRPRDTGPADYGVFGHGGGAPISDMEAIRAEIEAQTARLAGDEKDICATPIVLRLHVAGAPSLTLVDLPGVTRVPVRGQPDDIGEKIKRLCQQFARNPRAVLLCVSAANADLATSEALVLAREVDRAGDRTIGVLTKTDLMDPGTDCASILRNEVFPLRLGYVAVVCRGQRDLDEGGTVAAAQSRERTFFANHEVYGAPRHRELLERSCGIAVLAQKLSALTSGSYAGGGASFKTGLPRAARPGGS